LSLFNVVFSISRPLIKPFNGFGTFNIASYVNLTAGVSKIGIYVLAYWDCPCENNYGCFLVYVNSLFNHCNPSASGWVLYLILIVNSFDVLSSNSISKVDPNYSYSEWIIL